jgi:hypothetical protein
MTLDLTKPIQTRDGRPARVLATDLNHSMGYSLTVAVGNRRGYEITEQYPPSGRFNPDEDRPYDLINVPEKSVTRFLNLGNAYSHLSSAKAEHDGTWDVLEVTTTGDTVTATKVHKHADA